MTGGDRAERDGARGPRRVWVADLPAEGSPIQLSPAESAHLVKVLRVRVGDTFDAFDGRGRLARCRLLGIDRKHGASATVEAALQGATALELPLAVHLLVAPPKGSRQEALVRGLVELGASRITPLITARGWLSPGARHDSVRERWQRYCVEACKQCRRDVLPEVARPTSLDDAVDQAGVHVVLDPDSPVALEAILGDIVTAGSVAVFVGPEGGFSADERERLPLREATAASLGGVVLRIETAAHAAMTLAASAARRVGGGGRSPPG